MENKTEVEQLKEHEDVRTALKQTAGNKEPAAKPVVPVRDKLWFSSTTVIGLVVLALYYLLGQGLLETGPITIAAEYIALLRRFLMGVFLVILVMTIAKSIRVYAINQIENLPARYNLSRVLSLLTVLMIVIIVLSVISATWYTALVSFGIISLILGFALQTPITSFIGWIYILIRQPYRVGDRIKIGDAKGDVIDVSYLDTTLWEVGGPYLSTEHPSGRIIKFPNSLVLNETVYNFSWPLFPYIWNEIKFHVAYDTDLEFVAQTMQQVVEEEVGEEMPRRVRVYRDLLSQTPVDELQINERPVIHFRASENTWLEVIVRYLVHPKEAGRIKTRLTQKMLEKLNIASERVLFPKSNLR